MANTINPFSTRFVKPGAQPFQFSADIDLSELMGALERHNWRGELVGPHGCGKSTLVQELIAHIPRQTLQFTVRSHERKTGKYAEILRSIQQADTPVLICIDGMEQFSVQQRSEIIRAIDRVDYGLLVTCHHSVGLPCLLKLEPDLPRFRKLVDQLLKGYSIELTCEEIDDAFAKHQPNVREALFSLYDIYERRRRKANK